MKMFVFQDVLRDYTAGMAMIAAETLEEAQRFAFEAFYTDQSFEVFVKNGWDIADGEYELNEQVEPGIKHYVYGGG